MARGQSARWLLVMQVLAGTVLAGDRLVAAVGRADGGARLGECPVNDLFV